MIEKLKSQKGSILVLSLAFFMITILAFGYIIDMQRLQLARQKLYVVSDMASLAGARVINTDKAMGVEGAIPDPENGPIIAEILPAGCDLAEDIINENQFNLMGNGWFNTEETPIQLVSGGCVRDNGDQTDPDERLMATLSIETQYVVEPMILSFLDTGSLIKAKAKSVIYLVL